MSSQPHLVSSPKNALVFYREYQMAIGRLEEAEEELAEAKITIKRLTNEIDENLERIAKLEESLELNKTSAEIELEEVTERADRYYSELEQERDENRYCKEQIEELEDKISSLEESNEDLRSQLDDFIAFEDATK